MTGISINEAGSTILHAESSEKLNSEMRFSMKFTMDTDIEGNK